jgi:threonine synthase
MNINNSFSNFIRGGTFEKRPVISTNSPDLDVCFPSNYERLNAFYDEAPAVMRNMVFPSPVENAATAKTMEQVWKQYRVLLNPHSAVAFAAALDHVKSDKFSSAHVVVLATEHPAKEAGLVKEATGQIVFAPERLSSLRKEVDPIALIDPELNALESAIASCF